MKYSHFLFLSLFALLSLSSHGFEQEHEHDFHEEDLTLGIFGTNLLDEIARNHSSTVKNEVPLPGKNLGIGFRVTL